MQKIEFRVEFQEIVYKVKPKKSFPVRLIAEAEEGTEIRHEQVVIPVDDGRVKTTEIAPFEFFLIASGERVFYLPHNLYFIVDRTPVIRRKIPLHLSSVYDHHLARSIQKDCTPLEWIYAFEEGKILYNVRIVRSSRVTEQQEVSRYEVELAQFSSLSSSRIKEQISQSRASKGPSSVRRVKPRPSFSVDDVADKLQAQDTLELEDGESSQKGEGGPSYLQSWHEFSQMEQEHRDKQIKAASVIKVKKQAPAQGFALRLIVLLVAIGFLLLAFDVYKDPKMKVILQEGKKMKRGGEVYNKINRKQKKGTKS